MSNNFRVKPKKQVINISVKTQNLLTILKNISENNSAKKSKSLC